MQKRNAPREEVAMATDDNVCKYFFLLLKNFQKNELNTFYKLEEMLSIIEI